MLQRSIPQQLNHVDAFRREGLDRNKFDPSVRITRRTPRLTRCSTLGDPSPRDGTLGDVAIPKSALQKKNRHPRRCETHPRRAGSIPPNRISSADQTASTRPTPHKHSRTPPRDKAGTYDLREPLRSPTAQSPANLLYRHSTHAGKPLAGRPGTLHSRPPARQRKRGYREGSDRTDRMRGSPNAVLVSLLCW